MRSAKPGNHLNLWCEWELTYPIPSSGISRNFDFKYLPPTCNNGAVCSLYGRPSNNQKLDCADEFYNIWGREQFRGNANTIGVI